MAINTKSIFLNEVFNSSYFNNVVVVSIIKQRLPPFPQWDQMWGSLTASKQEKLTKEIRQYLGQPTNFIEGGEEYLIDAVKTRQIFERLHFLYNED